MSGLARRSTYICPTVTATNPREYRAQIELISEFAERIHVDFSDGEFAPNKLVPLEESWWPIGMMADIHLMVTKPLDLLDEVIALQPHLVVIHAEAESVGTFLQELEGLGIKRGIALLQDTPASIIKDYIDDLDHVLVFSGHLGYHGGTADLALLDKVKAVRAMSAELELGWDGGIAASNAKALVDGGVEVLNVGGFIHRSPEPEKAYDTLKAIGD